MKKWKTRGISLLLALVLITGGTTAAFPGQSCRKRGNRITGSLPDGADDRENPV